MRRRLLGLCLLWPATALAMPTVDEEWSLSLASGTQVEVVLRRPLEVTEPLPAILLFGGFQGAAQVLDHIQTERAIIRASFPYPYAAPKDFSIWSLPDYLRAFRRGVDDTFAGIAALVQALRQRPDVDASRLMIVGASAGAPFATIAGARENLPGVIVVQGFGDLGDVIARQFVLGLEDDYGVWVRPVAWLFSHFLVWQLELPAPEDFARSFGPAQQVLVVNARDDERIPAGAIESLWQAVDESQAQATRMDLPGGHLRGYGDPQIERILTRALDWMEARELLPPEPTR